MTQPSSSGAPELRNDSPRWTDWGYPPRPTAEIVHHIAGVPGALLLPLLCCGRTIGTDIGPVTVDVDVRKVSCAGIAPPDVSPRNPGARECRDCWATVLPVHGVIPLHGRRDRHPCPGSRAEVRDQMRPLAPDEAQEGLRARAGFPWCDTCRRPTAGGDRPTEHVTLTAGWGGGDGAVYATPDRTDRGHTASMRQWDAAQ